MARLTCALAKAERLSDLVSRLSAPTGRARFSDWEAEAHLAAVFGLLSVTGAGDDLTVRRTTFGDAWSQGLDPLGCWPRTRMPWPLQGPGVYEVEFYPLTQRPTFPLFALTGAPVTDIRQGGWNLEQGFGHEQPNPVSDVDMLSALADGSKVLVETSNRERLLLPALRLSSQKNFLSIAEWLMSALVTRAAPWQLRPVDVDGSTHEMCVLDLNSQDLPAGVIGSPLLAVGNIDGVELTVISDKSDVELAFTRIPIADLVPATNEPILWPQEQPE